MTKALTDYSNADYRLWEYGDNPPLDGSAEYGGERIGHVDTNYTANTTYAAARTGYDDHVAYDAHMPYIGRDPELNPRSDRARSNSSKPAKPLTRTVRL